MQVIDRTQTNNTLNFIPKSYNPTGANIFKVVIKNEDQNKEVHSATVSSFPAVDYYYTYTAALQQDQTKDFTYLLEITNTATGSILYRDKILGTNQTVADYSLNAGIYTTNTTQSNDYLVYE